MSNIEQIDFSTLTWVKTELDETLNRAKEALKAYVEDSEDTNQLQFCVTYLHQIQGTLKMVELYGAAMVAEEMEWVAKDLIDGKLTDEDAAYDVLMQSILQLPDYLERIELGHKDVPIVLLPLVNDLRAVRSQKLLSESALFNPNLELGVPDRIVENDVSLKGNQLKTALLKIRSIFQIALLNWIRNGDDSKGLNNMQLVISKLQMILSPVYLKQLFWTFSGVIEGLMNNQIDDGVAVKQIAGKVDHLIKELIDGSPHTKSSSRAITKNMLYYIAISEESGRLSKEIKSFFDLSQFIPDQDEIKHAEGSLSGKNKELLQTVSEAINDDVLVVQESLDLFIRNKSAQVEELAPLLENLHKISDTLGILGLGVARESVTDHQNKLKTMVDDNQRPSDEELLDVAKTLLKIESQLGDHIQSLGITDETAGDEDEVIPKSEQKAILQQLAKESIINLQQIKTNFVAFIESPWDKNQVKDNPRLLKDIAGAMKILNLSEAGGHLDAIIDYVNTDILGKESKPSAMQLEQLATVVSSLEYYLENLDQGQRIRDNLLTQVGKQIEELQQASKDDDRQTVAATPETEEAVAEDSTAAETADGEGSDEAASEKVAEEAEADAENVTESTTESDDAEAADEAATETQAEDAEPAAEAATVASTLVVEFGDDVDDEIKEVFLEEFEEELANMQDRHSSWKEDPDEHADKLVEIRRIFHTLKGSGRLVGAEAIGEFGWMLENMCNRLLDGGIKHSTDFKHILDAGVEMAAGLYAALQEQGTVPVGYKTLLQNAENVANGEPIITAMEVVGEPESVSSDAEAAPAEVTEAGEEVAEEAIEETVEEAVEEAAEDVAEADTEEAAETEAEEAAESETEELIEDVVAAAAEDEAEDEEDMSLDFVEYDLADLQEEAATEQEEATAATDEATEVEEADAEDDMSIDFDTDGLSIDLEVDEIEPVPVDSEETAAEEAAEALAADADSGDDNTVAEIDLDEDEINDLEAELAQFEGDESLLLDDDQSADEAEAETEAADDDGFDLDDLDLDDVDLADMDFGTEEEAAEEAAEETAEIDSAEFDLSDEDMSEEDVAALLNMADADDEAEVVEDTADADAEDTADVMTLTESEEDAETSYDMDVDPVFVEILQKEVGGHLSEMSQFVSDCMEQDEPKINDDFVRVVHTLNGAASMASVNGITSMTTPLEKMSIMIMDRDQTLTTDDISQIEAVITHAKSQLNLLGTGEVPVDGSIGEYFVNRINELNTSVEDIKDAEDLAVESNQLEAEAEKSLAAETASDDVAEAEAAADETAEAETAEEETAEEETAEEETAEEETAEEETAEEEVAEEATPEEPAPSPFMAMDEADSDSTFDASEVELDDELLEIFSEEATEIFDRADHLLAELEEKPDSTNIIQALQRDLHTLKGGARMAGLNQIGDLSHQLESLFESIAESKQEVSSDQHEMMSQVMHKLHGMVNSEDYGLTTSIEQETQQLEDILSSEGGEIKEKSKLDEEFFDPLAQVDEAVEESDAPEEAAAVQRKKANVLSGGQIKVNSELLDKLVNFAGEVSIYRSRMEQQAAELRLNIDELENTVDRVRRQLRELEHETEAQIISNYQIEGDELEEDFDPLELDQFSTIQQLSRSLSESVSDLTNIQSYLQESARSSETLLIQQSRVNTELQEGLMETRLVTFNSLVPRLRRVLRTSGQELSKKAKLTVKGAEGEMDKTVLEGIQAPLEHMIRNAMVHGIEDNRKKAKKSDQGQIVIELSREATEVVITVSDDGAGINTDVLKKKAMERGIIDKKDELTEQDIVQLILHSGMSTADQVTKLAGRGVGMDVVNNEIKRLGGSIEILSEQGQGTTFVIRLPYTLALTQAIIVQVADHRYAIPASGVQGLIRMHIDEFRRRILENDLEYDYAGETYHLQELNKLLSVDSEAMVEGNQVPLVMIKSGDQGVALRVDQTFGGREIVVKSVGTQVASVPGIFGATILGDGAVVLILDIIPMHRAYTQKLARMEAEGVQVVEEVEDDRVTTIMVVDDSITMRRAGERMLTRNDFEVMTAKDGLDALNKLQEQKPDLMLLDIEMPRMDGFELATNMKASDKFKDIPIIMITSRTGQKHKDRAKEIGVERYLGKPYQEIELLENIKDLLQLEDA
ncbi:hybrid sensor histidine kinase/response regulator [Marinicella meishanensis]|uniref:hybrid sensor histidine kinase/response regulator n=1 Tax=Marinicella meishanensis TaxID=2873263 RepID=UPI001CC11CC3|nr:Hpt domain-containing protein [Marinicella sp. NBU2979]